MIGFRNVLVHEYMDVDRRLVYEVLQSNLGEFRAIIAVLSSWLS